MTASGDLPNSIQEVGQSKTENLLVYAMWGVGKTIFVGSGGPKTLIIRPPTDHTDSIITMYPAGHRPKEWIVKDWDSMTEVVEYLRLHGHEWEWVWLDSLSLWQDTGLDDIWAATIAHNPARNVKHAGLDKGEYGRNMDRISAWVRDVVGIDTFNFGITCFPTTRFEAPGSDDRKMMPWVQGKMMSEKICGYMNMVGYMEKKISPSTKREYRQITFKETEDFYAKDQYDAFPNGKLIDPTIPKLMELVAAAKDGKGAKPTAPAQRGGKKKKGATT